MAVIPTPLSAADRAGGYWWELSMRQVEVSRTIVFDAPRRGRAFFEAVVADNLDIGRPSEVRLIFDRQIRRTTKGPFRTRVVTRGTEVTLDVNYRDSRIKEYLKEGRALRIETVVNSPNDLGCQRRLRNLDELQAKARARQPAPPRAPTCRPELCHLDLAPRNPTTTVGVMAVFAHLEHGQGAEDPNGRPKRWSVQPDGSPPTSAHLGRQPVAHQPKARGPLPGLHLAVGDVGDVIIMPPIWWSLFQLDLASASDARLDDFIRRFRNGPDTPEPGAPCTGGEGTPQ